MCDCKLYLPTYLPTYQPTYLINMLTYFTCLTYLLTYFTCRTCLLTHSLTYLLTHLLAYFPLFQHLVPVWPYWSSPSPSRSTATSAATATASATGWDGAGPSSSWRPPCVWVWTTWYGRPAEPSAVSGAGNPNTTTGPSSGRSDPGQWTGLSRPGELGERQGQGQREHGLSRPWWMSGSDRKGKTWRGRLSMQQHGLSRPAETGVRQKGQTERDRLSVKQHDLSRPGELGERQETGMLNWVSLVLGELRRDRKSKTERGRLSMKQHASLILVNLGRDRQGAERTGSLSSLVNWEETERAKHGLSRPWWIEERQKEQDRKEKTEHAATWSLSSWRNGERHKRAKVKDIMNSMMLSLLIVLVKLGETEGAKQKSAEWAGTWSLSSW